MWYYDKKLEYPINIKKCDPRMAKYIISQYGGPDGELAASLRYLSQRFHMPTKETRAIGTMVHQLTKGVPADIMEKAGLGDFYTDHDNAVYPMSAAGNPFTAAYIQSKGDVIADLVEDLAAEQKARATYENLIRLADDPDVKDPLRFLREREVVHFQRFGEALRQVQELMGSKKYY